MLSAAPEAAIIAAATASVATDPPATDSYLVEYLFVHGSAGPKCLWRCECVTYAARLQHTSVILPM